MHFKLHWIITLTLFTIVCSCRNLKGGIPELTPAGQDQAKAVETSPGATGVSFFPEEADPEWCGWRGPAGNGTYPSTSWSPDALLKQDAVLWERNAGRGYAALSVQDYYLYTIGYANKQDTVYCLDASTGAVLWEYKYPSDPGYWQGPQATPIVDGNRVYSLSKAGLLHCLEAQTGRVIWQHDLETDYGMGRHFYGISGSPVIYGDILLLNLNLSGMALNKYTGKLVWNSATEENSFASPVLYRNGDMDCAVLFGLKAIRGVKAATGAVLWEYPWVTYENINAADPLVTGNTVFVSSNYNKGCALLDISGSIPVLLWQNKNLMSHVGSFIYLDGYLYGNNGDINKSKGVFRCLDIKTGQIQWESAESGAGSLVASNGYLLLLTERGELRIIKAAPAAYEELVSRKVLKPNCWTAPVFYKGRLYCRNDRGDIVCINLRRT